MILEAPAAKSALTIAREVFLRLAATDSILSTYEAPEQPTKTIPWRARSLATGTAGLALSLALADATWPGLCLRDAAHEYLAHAATGAGVGNDAGLFVGWAGVLAAAQFASGGTQLYRRLQSTIQEFLRNRVDRLIAVGDSPFAPQDFVGGAPGLVAVLGRGSPIRGRIMGFLESLSAPHFNDGGTAHGISGVLGALNLCDYRGSIAAEFARRLMDFARPTEYGIRFAAELGENCRPFYRVAWCYGTAGAANVLYDYARLNEDRNAEAIAFESMRTLLTLPKREWHLWDNGLCHGTSGAAILIGEFALKANDEELISLSRELMSSVIDAFDPSMPFFYRSVDPYHDMSADDPGFIEGAAGIALALMTAAGVVTPMWLRILGIRPAQRQGNRNI